MKLNTPRIEQGQIIIRSYGWLEGALYRRTEDQSEPHGSPERVTWARAANTDAVPEHYDAGCADYPPPVSSWVPCTEPRDADDE
jgi:hypothetical protein